MLDDASIFKDVDDRLKTDKENLLVRIGDIEGNPDVAVVTTKSKVGGEENTIALVGPTRMDYEKAMSAMEYLAEQLNEYFSKKG